MPLETINLSLSRPDGKGGGKDGGGDRKGASVGKDGGFQATPEELDAIREKIKDPVFAKLMHEYMESLSDPETLREEEAYLEQAERESKSGGDFSFEFIFPRPGFVVELLNPTTRIISASDAKKFAPMVGGAVSTLRDVRSFVNMCSSEKVPVYREEPTGDRMASNWQVPVSVSQKRIELFSGAMKGTKEMDGKPSKGENSKAADAHNGWCYVYDAVFHPQTLSLADRSNRFLCFLVEIAVEHINSGYHESNGFEFTRLSSTVATVVGTLKNQTIRTKDNKGASLFEARRDAPLLTRPTAQLQEVDAGVGPCFPAVSPASSPSEGRGEAPARRQLDDFSNAEGRPEGKAAADAKPLLPPHSILHRGHIDLTDAWSWKVVDKRIGVPEELVVKLTFDGVHSASGLDISITEDGGAVRIDKTAAQSRYEGLLVLPFTVRGTPVSARFDRATHVLTLVLGVIPPVPSEQSVAAAEEVRQRYMAVGKPDASFSVAHGGDDGGVGVPANGKTTGVAAADTSSGTGEAMGHADGGSDNPQGVGYPAGATVIAPEPASVDTSGTECLQGAAPHGNDRDGAIAAIEPTPAGSQPLPHPPPPLADATPVGEPAPVPEGQGDVFQHFDNSSRAQMALAKVMEARRAREAAARAAAEITHDEGGEGAATDGAEGGTGFVQDEGADTQREGSTAPERKTCSVLGVGSVPEESEAAALAAQQDAWVRKLEEQMAAVTAKEAEEVETTALKVQRDAQRSKKRLEKLMELEEMERRVHQKVKAIPLKNRHIFSID